MENPIAQLRTKRLQFARIEPTDAPFLLELHNSDPWQQNIGDRGLRSVEDAANYIRDSYQPLYEKGMGPYKLVKETGEVVGTCGLYQRDNLEHPDLGYALLPKFFKQGYALEATSAFLKLLKEKSEFDRILAITLPTNRSSVALLLKLDFELQGSFRLADDPEELHLFSRCL